MMSYDDLEQVMERIRQLLSDGTPRTLGEIAEQAGTLSYVTREATIEALRRLLAADEVRPVWNLSDPWVRYATASVVPRIELG